MPGSQLQAAGDESSLGTGGRKETPVLEAGATEELLEDLWKLRGSLGNSATKARSTQNVQDSRRAETDSRGVVDGAGRGGGEGPPPSMGAPSGGDGGAQELDGGERCTTG